MYSQPYDQSSNPLLHLPSQHPQFHFASPAKQNTQAGESATASNPGGKHKSTSAKTTQSQKRPCILAVPTTDPASLQCGVAPLATVENYSPPFTPVRLLGTASASFQRPTYNRHPTEHSAAAINVWYFCQPQNSPTKPVKQPAPDQDQLLTR